jgi:hypothetical protein
MPDGGAGNSVLAVPAVAIEEDEVGFALVVYHLIDSDESLDRRAASALGEGVEVDDPDDASNWRWLPLKGPTPDPPVAALPASLAPSRPLPRLHASFPRDRPGLACLSSTVRASPRIVDSAHSCSYDV